MARTAEEIAAAKEKREQNAERLNREARQKVAGRVKRGKMRDGELLQALDLSPAELRWLADPKNRAIFAKLVRTGRASSEAVEPAQLVVAAE